MSSDENGVVIEVDLNDGKGCFSGRVHILIFDYIVWSQISQNIDGEVVNDLSGGSIFLLTDGILVIIKAWE